MDFEIWFWRLASGSILLSVDCDSSEEVPRAKDFLKGAGGDDVASAGENAVSTHTVGTDTDADWLRSTGVRSSEVGTTTNDVLPSERTTIKNNHY